MLFHRRGSRTLSRAFALLTSMVLLLSVASADVAPLLVALQNAGVAAVEIGEVLPPGKPLIQVV